VGLIARTAADARDTMIEGESGLISICPPWFKPEYQPSKRRLVWPNGAQATTYSGDEPDQLRGPQHEFVWADELAAWKYAEEAWDNAMFGLRLGISKALITTTPRPIKVLRDLVKDPRVVKTTGPTYENLENLSEAYQDIIMKYEGTRLGEQELQGRLLEDIPGALWTRTMIEKSRVFKVPGLLRMVVGMDPAATSTHEASEMGIVICAKGDDGDGYVLEDASRRETPLKAAQGAVAAYNRNKADRIVGEVNNGGEWIEALLRTVDPNVSYKSVHASRGKIARAEPISSLYEQGRIHHVGTFEALEDQMCTYTPGEPSPDRMDALVWALTELKIQPGRSGKSSKTVQPVKDEPSLWTLTPGIAIGPPSARSPLNKEGRLW
jgi:phage terminase large subunit-like protein